MAIEIPRLDIYTILKLADGTEIKMPEDMYSYGASQVRIFMFPENRTLEDLELLLGKSENTHRIQILSRDKETVHATLNGYTTLHNLEKRYKEAYRKEYDNEGNYNVYTTDLFIVELRKPSADDLMPKFQSDLEYIAIMSDIDIDGDTDK